MLIQADAIGNLISKIFLNNIHEALSETIKEIKKLLIFRAAN